MLLEPVDRLCIEMIRWFVEQKQVWLLNQQLAQSHATKFASRKLIDACIPWWQIHNCHRHFHLSVEVPQVLRVDDILQLGHLVAKLFHLLVIGHFAEQVGDFVVSINDRATGSNRFLNVSLYVFVGIELRFLREIAGGVTVSKSCGTVEVFVSAGHDSQ